ncbi:MAG: mannose-1-phosphate guanylyltransferase [Chloroflexota bacterium]
MYYAMIMAGGTGTRLWPLSREGQPKQALTLVGERSMFQHAVDRLAPLFAPQQILVVTRAEHVALLSAQTPELPAENFIVEPDGRGTAPAIALAAVHLLRQDPQAVMAVVTADHFIADTAAFRQSLDAARQAAEQDYLVTLGIRPTYPATGFGYIHQGERLGQFNGLPYYRALRFTEKPNPQAAAAMLDSGAYSWNSGLFIWKAARVMQEFQRQMPAFYAQLMEVDAALGTPEYPAVIGRIWPQVAKQTIDYGVMEGAAQVAVIPVEIGWADIGSWGSLLDLLPADENGNIAVGPHLALQTSSCLVFGGKRLVATLGVRDLVIVDTPDALLVMSKDQEQQVKQIVDQLKAEGRKDLL